MTINGDKGARPHESRVERLSNRNFLFLSAIVMLLSLLLAPFFAHHYDPNVIAYAGVQVANGIDPYGLEKWWIGYSYPPLYLYYSSLLGYLLNDIPLNPLPEFRIPPLHLLLIKLPSILSHQAIATILFRSSNPRFPKYLSFLYLICPFPIFITAIWGNIDELCALFLLLTAVYLYRGRWAMAGLMWAIACALKLYVFMVIVMLPLLVINSRQGVSLRRFLSFFLVSSGFFVLVSVPFILWNSNAFFSTLVWRIGFSGWTYDIGLSYAVGIRGLISLLGVSFSFLLWIPPAVSVILLSYYILLLYNSNRSYKDFDELNSSILALAMIALLSAMVVNEMNYVWAMALLLIYWAKRDKHASKKFMMLNVILLIAVMIDWTPLDFIPGVDPSLVPQYQVGGVYQFGSVGNIFRFLALASLGIYISIGILFREVIKIFNEQRGKSKG